MRCEPPVVHTTGTRTRYDAIIIGTGVAGVVTAALLTKVGLSVISLERQEEVGGSLSSFVRDGFKLDRAGHLLSRGARGPFGWLWRELGIEHPRFLTHRRPLRSRGALDLIAPESGWGLMRLTRDLSRGLGLNVTERGSLGRLFRRLLTIPEPELQRLDHVTLETFLLKRVDHPGVFHLFAFLANVLFLLPPWKVSAGESIRTIRWMIRDYSISYVEGGLDCIPNTLLSFAGNNGGDVVTRSPVSVVRRRHGEFLVATESGDEYRAPIVVANVAPRDALDLMEDIDLPGSYRSRVAELQPSGVAHTLRLGLERPLMEEGCMLANLLPMSSSGPLSFDRLFETAEAAAAGSDPISLLAPVPTNFDPTLAPEGSQLLVANIYDPNGNAHGSKERALGLLREAVPGLDDAIVMEEFQPLGAPIATGQIAGQVGEARLPVTTPIPGFYITGWGAGGRGIGIELAASSALETYFAIGSRG